MAVRHRPARHHPIGRQEATIGAWGSGLFENDDASDFVGDAMDTPGDEIVGLVEETLTAVTEEEYAEAPEACMALAAAACVATSLGHSVPDLDPELASRCATTSGLQTLKVAARDAVGRILAPESELRELWEEAESLEEWATHVRSLQAML